MRWTNHRTGLLSHLRRGFARQRLLHWRTLLVAVLLVGCAPKPKHTLVGEWTGNVASEGAKVDVAVVFGSDGTMTMRQTAEGRAQTESGTYRLDGESLTFTPTSVEAPGLSKEQAEAIRTALAKEPKPLVFRIR